MVSTSRSNSAAAPHLALIAVQILFATWPIVGKIALRAVIASLLIFAGVIAVTRRREKPNEEVSERLEAL